MPPLGVTESSRNDNILVSVERSSSTDRQQCHDILIKTTTSAATTTTTHSSKQQHERTVKISNAVEIHPVLHRRDMSRDEIQKTWINRYERRQTRTAIHNTLYLMKTGVGCKLSEDDHVCPRGLEHYLYRDEVSIDYDEEAKKSQQIALAMQRLLRRRTGTTSPEMIARAYSKYTIRSTRVAYEKAMRDRAEVDSHPLTK
jgi:hypothetical protein